MRRTVRLLAHGLGVGGAALGIETLTATALPGLAQFLPLAALVEPRTGGPLAAALVLIGAALLAASS